MSTEVKKKKKSGSRDNNKLVALIAVVLAVVVITVSVLSIVIVSAGNYVAKVNGQKLYNYEYTYYLNQELSKMQEEMAEGLKDDATDTEKEEAYKKYLTTKGEDGKYPLMRAKEAALEELRLFKTSYQLAKEAGYALTKEEANNVEDNVDYVINYYQQIYSYTSQSVSYDQIVAQVCANMTVKQYKEYAKQDTTIAKYKEAMKEEYNITDDEMRKVYEEDINDYRKVTVQKFFLSNQSKDENGKTVDMTADEKAAVKAKINDYLAKFKSGEYKFEEKIKSDSQESNSATSAGKSTINNDSKTGVDVVDEWALKVEKADTGAYEILEAEDGYYIIQCTEIEDFDNSEDSEEGANDSIKNTIKAEIEEERATEEMREKAEKAEGYQLESQKKDNLDRVFNENDYIVAYVKAGAKLAD